MTERFHIDLPDHVHTVQRDAMVEHADRYEKRNFLINAVEGALFLASGAFVSLQTVLPALVARLGGTNVEVGAVGVIAYLGLFLPQIFAARFVETHPWKKPWTMRGGLAHRSVILLMGVMVLIFGNSRPVLTLWLFLALYMLGQMLTGITTPAWFDLFAKLTPARKRGRLVGIRTSIGGVGAFLCGFVLTWLLGSFVFPTGYAVAFFLAFTLQISSLLFQTGLVEEMPSSTDHRKPFFTFLRGLPEVLRQNAEFRRFLLSSSFLVLSTMPVGFFTVYALRHFGGQESMVGQFTLAMVAAQVVSALVNGYVADRYGNKAALVCAGGGMLCASLWALLAPSLEWFTLVYLFLGVNIGTELMARYNIAVEYGPARQRATYIGLMNTILAPFYLCGIIGGVVSDAFGYHAVFVLGALFSILGIYVLLSRVRDPRTMPANAVTEP